MARLDGSFPAYEPRPTRMKRSRAALRTGVATRENYLLRARFVTCPGISGGPL